ncbi:MAG: serine hydrolase domain-containing protein [Actinomycetota bacterium]
MNTAVERQHAVANGLVPIVRIAEQPLRWTIDERLAHHRCPGTSVAVMHEGRIDWADGFGLADTDTGAPCGPDTVFMVASCSKPVTAMLVLQQVERGVLDLDTDVNHYLQRWKVPHNDFTAAQPVTLRHALSHTAGLTVGGWGTVVNDGRPVATVLDLLHGRPPSKMGPVFVDKAYDGTDRYSGGGYVIAQCVLEDVLGRGFDELADEMIFHPLGMTRSTYSSPPPIALRVDIASGHDPDAHPYAGGWMMSSEMGAGGLMSTARDYATFLLACRAAYRGEPGALLAQSLAREAMTRHDRSAFGLGFRVLGEGATRRVNHGGSNDGYQSETDTFLESGDGAVVLTNAVSGIFLYREILNGIAEVYDWPGFLLPPRHLKTLTDDDFHALVGAYRVVSGIEMPLLRVWREGDRLFTAIDGMRFGEQETFCDTDGVLFNQTGPFETFVRRGPDGRVTDLEVREGDVIILRAERADD